MGIKIVSISESCYNTLDNDLILAQFVALQGTYFMTNRSMLLLWPILPIIKGPVHPISLPDSYSIHCSLSCVGFILHVFIPW